MKFFGSWARLFIFGALVSLALQPALARAEEVSGSPPGPAPLEPASTVRPPAPKNAPIAPQKLKNTDTKIIPLPIYATLPNEGSTYGFMPVFLVVDSYTQHTEHIIAPSISWNRIIRFTGTFRWYHYASDVESLTLIPSVSTNVNRGVTFEWSKLPSYEGALTEEAWVHGRRSIFYRFFGIGPDTHGGDESSYTRVGGDAGGRVGLNVTRYLNVGARISGQRDLVERKHVDFLPLTNDVFPGTPGLGGATTLFEGVSLRFDTRPQREYSISGVAAELLGGYTEGLSGSPGFSVTQFETRYLWPELDWVSGGARAFWGYTGGHDIPFYNQTSLGGSFRLRGFTEDRFIDKGGWEAEIEQRIVLFQTHIYGVTADWRIDPFFAIGQVYHDLSDAVNHVRPAGGLGFRAFVRPNVLGRVDTAVGGEGIKVYVELGYAF